MKLTAYTNPNPKSYQTKDKTGIRELLNAEAFPGLGMSLAEASLPAGEKSAEHRHADFDEIYYGLDGTGTLFINGLPHYFAPRAFYLIPRGSSHYLAAESELRLLCICQPGYSHAGTELL